MRKTVTECLKAGSYAVEIINDIVANGAASQYANEGESQAYITDRVQRNVNHLVLMLKYDGTGSWKPNIASENTSLKTTHIAAVTAGTKYIKDN